MNTTTLELDFLPLIHDTGRLDLDFTRNILLKHVLH